MPEATATLDRLDSCPVVEDFAVTIRDTDDASGLIEFVSPTLGRLAGFPAWEHADRDLRHFVPSDVPLGTRAEPFVDEDEAWCILIFQEAGWVYVAEGDAPRATSYERVFRVRRERYLQAWAALIDIYNPITPLDESS
ncbi:MAG TPA: hypothetical protein VF701_07110 [Thermoanaerobaculia bacterium]